MSVELVSESISVNFSDFLREQEDYDSIYKLHMGEPKYKVHKKIISSVKINLSGNSYSNSRGDIELRKEICNKLKISNKINADYNRNILITNGAIHAINISISLLINEGDECIILEPYWKAYESLVILNKGIPVFINLGINKKFTDIVSEIKAKISSKTKLIILNFPNNPTGQLINKKDFEELINIISKKNIFILSDEVYEDFVYDKKDRFSPGSIDSIKDNIISVFSFSKSYGMTGYRVGYLVANSNIVSNALKLSQYSITCLSPAYQKGALKALGLNKFRDKGVLEFFNRINYVKGLILNTKLDDKIIFPKSGFYLLYDISKYKMSSLDCAKKIVSEYNISLCPGIAFGKNFDSYLRISLTENKSDLKIIFDRLVIFENQFQ